MPTDEQQEQQQQHQRRHKQPLIAVLKTEKLLAAIALINPLSLVACFYTLINDEWHAIEFSNTMFVTRGIFRVCTTSLGGTECQSNDVTTDFTMGECVRSAASAKTRLNAALAMHVIGGLFTTFAWMLTAHGYRVAAREDGDVDRTSLIATINSGGACVCFCISTAIMTSTFVWGWYTCGRSYCDYIATKRYCNEDLGNSLIAGYVSVALSFTCFALAFIRSRRQATAQQRVQKKAEREPLGDIAAPASNGAKKAPPRGPAAAAAKSPPSHRHAPGASSLSKPQLTRLKRYFEIYAPGLTEREIVAIAVPYITNRPGDGGGGGGDEALWRDLVAEYGPELSSARRRDILSERGEVRKFCDQHGIESSDAEIAQVVNATFAAGGDDPSKALESMWRQLEALVVVVAAPKPQPKPAPAVVAASPRAVAPPPPPQQQQHQNPVAKSFPPSSPSPSKKVLVRPRPSEASLPPTAPPEAAASRTVLPQDGLEAWLAVDYAAAAQDWVEESSTGLVWSGTLQVFYDVASGEYYEPLVRKLWYNPVAKEWHAV